MKWIKNINTGNEILKGRWFYISYNPTAMSLNNVGETALCHKENGSTKFYILNGDWRKQYEELKPLGYKACKTFFESKRDEHGNFWSN